MQSWKSIITWDSEPHKLRSLQFQRMDVALSGNDFYFSLLKWERNLLLLSWCECEWVGFIDLIETSLY